MIILLASLLAQSANLQMSVVKNVKVIFVTSKIVLSLQIFFNQIASLDVNNVLVQEMESAHLVSQDSFTSVTLLEAIASLFVHMDINLITAPIIV